MVKSLSVPKECVFLSLGEEVLPLIKRGVIPLAKADDAGLLWVRKFSTQAKVAADRVSDADYLAHLKAEYARLPENLRSLLSEEGFIQQAEKKRRDIETALLRQKQTQKAEELGNIDDWLLQRFYRDAFSPISWQQAGGTTRVWLGIDPKQWDGVTLSEVQYGHNLPANYPKRLLADHVSWQDLAEMRLVQAIESTEKVVQIQGKVQGLLRLPPKALRCVLLGVDANPKFIKIFMQYWKHDFRYQRIPVAKMALSRDSFEWHFNIIEE